MDEKKTNELPEEALQNVAGGVMLPGDKRSNQQDQNMQRIVSLLGEKYYSIRGMHFSDGTHLCAGCQQKLTKAWKYELCLNCAKDMYSGKLVL